MVRSGNEPYLNGFENVLAVALFSGFRWVLIVELGKHSITRRGDIVSATAQSLGFVFIYKVAIDFALELPR